MGNGRGRKGSGDGREREGGGKKGKDPHCLKCIDTHADLPIIKQLLTFWYSGALRNEMPERQRLIKIVNKS